MQNLLRTPPPTLLQISLLFSSVTDQLTFKNNQCIVLKASLLFVSRHVFLTSIPSANTSKEQLHTSPTYILAPQVLYVILPLADITFTYVEALTEGPLSVGVTLCVFAERLDGDVYVGSYLVMVNLPDVCVFLPNGPHRFTLCHQTFSLALGKPPRRSFVILLPKPPCILQDIKASTT